MDTMDKPLSVDVGTITDMDDPMATALPSAYAASSSPSSPPPPPRRAPPVVDGGKGTKGRLYRPAPAASGHPNRAFRYRRPVNTKSVQLSAKSLPVSRRQGRGVDGFFPPVKLRESAGFLSPGSEGKRKGPDMQTPPFLLELAPEEASLWAGDLSVGHRGPGARVPSSKSSAARSHVSDTSGRHQYPLSMTPPVYAHVTSDEPCDDLTTMPRPRMMVSRGELPWVFRQKVKRSMNTLCQIMASRPPQSLDASTPFRHHIDH